MSPLKPPVGPFRPEDELPPLRQYEHLHGRSRPPRVSGTRFAILMMMVAWTGLGVYLGIANYCRFKQAAGFPTTNCTCY